MENIKIKVAEKTAEQWKNASPRLRAEIEKSFRGQIERLLYQSKLANFDVLVNKIRNEAESNGLTENKLQDILKEDA